MKRTVLLTGSSSGIGKAIAKNLLKNMYKVVGLCRTNKLEPTSLFHFFPLDLNYPEKIKELLVKLHKSHPEINTLICNAGKGLFGSLEQYSIPQIQSCLHVNFLSHVYIVRFFLPFLKKLDRADIIFIGSEAALQGKKQGSIYCASKFALRGFAQALREECSKSSVRVSIVQPGMTQTPFFDRLHFRPEKHCALQPHTIAQAVQMILHLDKQAVCDEIILSPLKKGIQKINPFVT